MLYKLYYGGMITRMLSEFPVESQFRLSEQKNESASPCPVTSGSEQTSYFKIREVSNRNIKGIPNENL